MDTTPPTAQDLERAQVITVEAFADLLDLHDSDTALHSRRVTAFTMAIARAMGAPASKIFTVARGAFLHDIGKIATPPTILRKAGALTPEETRIVREHCLQGYDVLRKVPFLAEAAEIVYAHHESWDGTGYPRQLKQNDIPLGARVVAVANALDAMTSDHPYRAAQSFDAARGEIKRWAGRQFDPEVVKLFLQMPESIWEYLRKDINDQSYKIASGK